MPLCFSILWPPEGAFSEFSPLSNDTFGDYFFRFLRGFFRRQAVQVVHKNQSCGKWSYVDMSLISNMFSICSEHTRALIESYRRSLLISNIASHSRFRRWFGKCRTSQITTEPKQWSPIGPSSNTVLITNLYMICPILLLEVLNTCLLVTYHFRNGGRVPGKSLLLWTITMTRWRLKSSALRLFTQPFIQAQIKENIKAPRLWPLWGEFTGDRWILRT